MDAAPKAGKPNRPFFPRRLREALRRDEGGWWATDLTEERLLALLSMVGQFCMKSHNVMHLLRVHRNRGSFPEVVRVRAALEVIRSIYSGDPEVTRREARRRIRAALRQEGWEETRSGWLVKSAKPEPAPRKREAK
jgi:hypothetical protein